MQKAPFSITRLVDVSGSDAIDLMNLLRGVRDDIKDDPANIERLIAMVGTHHVLVVRDGFGRVIATLRVRFVTDDLTGVLRAHVEDLIVIVTERRRGIGGRLVDRAFEIAREQGAKELVLFFRATKTETLRFIETMSERNNIVDFRKESLRSVRCPL